MSKDLIIKLKTRQTNENEYLIKEITSLQDLLSHINLNKDKNSVSLRFSLDEEEVIIEEDDKERVYKNKIHPFFNSKINKTSQNIENSLIYHKKIDFSEDFTKKKKDFTIIFSPHQDDEILGSSTVISSLIHNKKNFNIVYLTNGKGGGNSEIRQVEAREALKLLGCNESHSIFMDFPFYSNPNREITKLDYELMKSLLLNQNPTRVFICADVFDPHKSHEKCFDIILNTLKDLSLISLIDVYFYYSTWYWPKMNEINCFLPYDVYFLKTKLKCMLEHTSQIRNSSMGDDERPFYERVSKRDFFFGKRFGYEYCEVFYKVDSI